MAKELADFRQGDTKKIKIDYGTGFDITGYQFWFTLRSDFGSAIVAQVSTTAGDHALDDVANGIAYIQLDSDVSKEIPAGKYVWDIQRSIPAVPPDVLTLLPTLKNVKDKIIVYEGVKLVDSIP